MFSGSSRWSRSTAARSVSRAFASVATFAAVAIHSTGRPQAMSKPCSDGASNGCPTWIRTMTRRVKVACATITPSGSDEWKGHAAALRTAVKAGKKLSAPPVVL